MKAFPATLVAATLFAVASAPAAAFADTVSLDAPLAGATLQSRDADMAVYFTPTADDAYEVVATYVATAAAGEPSRLVMALSRNDRVRFSLPGHPGTVYEFARSGDVVTVSTASARTQAVARHAPAEAARSASPRSSGM